MGLFSTVLHIYKKSQAEVANSLANELQQAYNILKVNKIDSKSEAFKNIFEGRMQAGVAYLITERHNNWITVIEVAGCSCRS